jgi:anti-sigma28 factor (negative regulator of flagellin synthesis)
VSIVIFFPTFRQIHVTRENIFSPSTLNIFEPLPDKPHGTSSPMRLHLDTTNSGANAVGAGTGATPGERTNRSGGAGDGSSTDRVAVSGASQAWAASFSDRSARIQQLTADVRGGSYQVSSAAISQSIVSSARL